MRPVRYHDLAREEFLHGTRRVLLKKFKFSLVYLTHEQETYVVAVAPFRKKPGYWKKRLDAG